jgi:hypothetical protein
MSSRFRVHPDATGFRNRNMNDLKPAHEQLIDWKDWYLPASSVFHGEVLHSYDQVLSEAEFSARFHELPSILDRLLEEAIELKVEFDPIIQYQSIWSTLPPLKATNSPEHDSIFDSVLMLANKMRILKRCGADSTLQETLQKKKLEINTLLVWSILMMKFVS